jgi:hypothetical protein
MKTTWLKLTLVSIFPVILSSCIKETIDSKTTLLVEKSWRFERYGLDENNNGVIEDAENYMMPCEEDDVFTFMFDGAGFFEGYALPCTEGEPAVINFTWSFSNNETELAIFAAPEKINKLDENILEVYYMDQNLQGEAVKFIRRFRH